MAKISDIYQWFYGLIRGRPTNFNWIIDKKLAGSGVPMSKKEVNRLINIQGIGTIVTIKALVTRMAWP